MNKFNRRRLLSEDSNSKTIKGQKYGFLTGILYLSPYTLSGFNLCANAKSAGCIHGCLYTAGRGAFNSIQAARLSKTQYYLENRADFLINLCLDIELLIIHAKNKGLTPLIRLNGTSDIRFENYPVEFKGKTYKNIFEAFPDTQFYDYTKLSNRKDIPKNYDLTFSYSGLPGFSRFVDQALQNKMRIAVVFRDIDSIPKKFLDRKVLPGDNSDIRHLEPKNCIVALYAKGKAKKDYSGFVIDRPVIYLKAA
jgi:hypothetical protein